MIFSPLTSKLLRLNRPHVRACDLAEKSWTVAPAEEIPSPAAIFSPEDMARITGYAAHSHQAQEMARLTPHTSSFRPTMASQFQDVVLCGGNLYAGSFKYPMRESRKLIAHITNEIPDGGVPCTSLWGGMYFGHWLAEDTALKLLADSFGQPTEIDFPQTPHQAAYNELFGITRHLLPDDCFVRKIVVVDSELSSSFRDGGWEIMRRQITARYGGEPHVGCMMLRGASGTKRVLVNEREVAERLRSIGFRIVDPSASTLDEILAAASGSRILVGVEGSQLAHGFHCLGEGGAMLVMQPPNRFGCVDKDRCDRKRIRYAFSVGHAEADGFRIEIDGLLRILDRVLSELRSFSAAGLP